MGSGCCSYENNKRVCTHRKRNVPHNEMHTSTIITVSSLSEVLSVVITVIIAIEGHFLQKRSLIVMSHWLLLRPPPTTLSAVKRRQCSPLSHSPPLHPSLDCFSELLQLIPPSEDITAYSHFKRAAVPINRAAVASDPQKVSQKS